MLSKTADTDEDLRAGTQLLRGQYDIYGPLAKGGFGITYLARDSLDRKVVIKECFPHAFCIRIGSNVAPAKPHLAPEFDRIVRQFKSEALRLAALTHPRIVSVHQVFEENGTAFLAMEHIQGDDLFTIVEDQPDRLNAAMIKSLLIEALDAVEYIHQQGLLHRDLAPDNVLLSADGHVTLIDFGAATELCTSGHEEDGKLLLVKDGYSPYEFYCDGAQDASSDLYALAATFHYMITGYSPPDSHSRMATIEAGQRDPFVPLTADAWGIDQAVLSSINLALSMDRDTRPGSAFEWLDLLEGTQAEAAAPVSPAAAMWSDPTIADEIAQLVSTTNSALAEKLTEKRKKDAKRKGAKGSQSENPPKPKQLVDLFGNPIHDLEAFMRDQNDTQDATPDETPDPQPEDLEVEASPASEASEDEAPEHQTMLGSLLGRMRPRKRTMPSAIPQN